MNLGMLLFMPAQIAGDSVILIDTSPELTGGEARHVTFAELLENSGKVAGMLQSLGVEVGVHVGLFATNSTECVEAIFASAFAAQFMRRSKKISAIAPRNTQCMRISRFYP